MADFLGLLKTKTTVGGLWIQFDWFPTEEARAKRAAEYIQQAFATPYIIGNHMFEFSDEPPGIAKILRTPIAA